MLTRKMFLIYEVPNTSFLAPNISSRCKKFNGPLPTSFCCLHVYSCPIHTCQVCMTKHRMILKKSSSGDLVKHIQVILSIFQFLVLGYQEPHKQLTACGNKDNCLIEKAFLYLHTALLNKVITLYRNCAL